MKRGRVWGAAALSWLLMQPGLLRFTVQQEHGIVMFGLIWADLLLFSAIETGQSQQPSTLSSPY